MTTHHNIRPACKTDAKQRLTFVSMFRPNEQNLLESLRDKKRETRQHSIEIFHNYYSQALNSIENQTIWLSGSLASYKLSDIRAVLKEHDAKLVTRETKGVTLLVVGEKTKVESLPPTLPCISAIRFEEMLNSLKELETEQESSEKGEGKLLNSLLSNLPDEVEKALELLDGKSLSLRLLPLVMAIFKVHKEKEIRTKAKALLAEQKSKTAKDAMSFCEKRNFLNAKYSVGMEELAKVKGFNIDLFLYYLVLNQKHHLGKEYLASLESEWSQKLIEEHELLNKKELILYGEAGASFVYAKKIEAFTVHAYSLVLWQMSWLKSLSIIELKERVVLPKQLEALSLERLHLETKELTLAGSLPIKTLLLSKCKKLEIDESFSLLNIESIRLDSCGFEMDVLKDFLKKSNVERLKTLEISNFVSYKMPKDLKEQMAEILPNVELLIHN